jgi:hypothetical protein
VGFVQLGDLAQRRRPIGFALKPEAAQNHVEMPVAVAPDQSDLERLGVFV